MSLLTENGSFLILQGASPVEAPKVPKRGLQDSNAVAASIANYVRMVEAALAAEALHVVWNYFSPVEAPKGAFGCQGKTESNLEGHMKTEDYYGANLFNYLVPEGD